MAEIITENDIEVSCDENMLIFSVAKEVAITKSIVAYYLLHNNTVLEKIFTSNTECIFTIRKNQSYRIKLFYRDEQNNNQSVISKDITPKLIPPTEDEIKRCIKLEFSKNKIICDASRCTDLIFQIKAYEFSSEITSVKIDTTGTFITHSIQDSGVYKVSLFYEDYNALIQQVDLSIHAVYTELSSEKIQEYDVDNTKQNLKLLFHIIYAFIIREFQRKYDKGYFRYFSIILGPAVQLIIMVTIFTIMGTKSVVGLSIPLFVLTGLLPYGFFTSAGNCLTIVSGNRALLSYKQVKIIDTILSSILMELMVTFTVFSGGIFICWYLGMHVVIYNPLSLLLSFILLFWLTFSLALLLSVVGFYFAEFNYAIQVVFRALFYISGVFFSIENIPVQYQKYVLWNPLLQIIEFIRFSFISFNLPYELSYLYLFKCTLVIFLLGLAMYFVNRNKFMVNDRAR